MNGPDIDHGARERRLYIGGAAVVFIVLTLVSWLFVFVVSIAGAAFSASEAASAAARLAAPFGALALFAFGWRNLIASRLPVSRSRLSPGAQTWIATLLLSPLAPLFWWYLLVLGGMGCC